MAQHLEPLEKELADAIELLKFAVKDSHLKNQKCIDLTVPMASERPKFERALALVNTYKNAGKISDSELKKRLGIS